MEQVKGVSYSLNEFLGPAYWKNGVEVQSEPVEFEKSLLLKKDTDLYHCVIYLAPGNWLLILDLKILTVHEKLLGSVTNGNNWWNEIRNQVTITVSTLLSSGQWTSGGTSPVNYSALTPA